ncbi:PH domain-containing protein [Georgenia subflava]|uniref:PH domain-containing protein n=1 Tax=Georgenia subflava TaxID=1622177 RepID=A0A6N7EK32_9MICO|nr:PH domain-containing protein [Georgenia subflava]MPV37147.1 PH domain-containing protein [Georgenia subflava]
MSSPTPASTSEHPRLRPPRNRADRRAIAWWSVEIALWFLPVIVVLVVLGLLITAARTWLLVPAGALAVVMVLALVIVPRWRYRNQLWELGEAAVYARSGWFWVESRIAPMSRIQTVDTRRGPLEQAFGLATVVVTTASSRGAVTISGLPGQTADEVVEQLTEITQATPGDAT